jgi:hypothetical protein
VLAEPECEHLGGDNKCVLVIFSDEVDWYSEKGSSAWFLMGLRLWPTRKLLFDKRDWNCLLECLRESFLLLLWEMVKLKGIVLEWRRTDVVSIVKCSERAASDFMEKLRKFNAKPNGMLHVPPPGTRWSV